MIARPFAGEPGSFARTSTATILARAAATELPLVVRDRGQHGPRRREDLRHLRRPRHRRVPPDQVERRGHPDRPRSSCRTLDGGFVFANLVETDMLWGHRNDPVELPPLPAGLRPAAARPPRRAARGDLLDRHVGPRLRPDDGVDRPLAGVRAAPRIRSRTQCGRADPRGGRVRGRRRHGECLARRQVGGQAPPRPPDRALTRPLVKSMDSRARGVTSPDS